MSKMKFELIPDAFGKEVMKSESLRKLLGQKAKEIQARCGDGYLSSATLEGRKWMAMGMVWTGDIDAMKDNSENNTLLKAIK